MNHKCKHDMNHIVDVLALARITQDDQCSTQLQSPTKSPIKRKTLKINLLEIYENQAKQSIGNALENNGKQD